MNVAIPRSGRAFQESKIRRFGSDTSFLNGPVEECPYTRNSRELHYISDSLLSY